MTITVPTHGTINCLAQKPAAVKSAVIWSPPDKSFSIEVPVHLERQPEEYADESRLAYERIDTYGVAKSDYVLILHVLELVRSQRKLTLAEKFGGLEFTLGGDDDHDFKELYIKVDGLPAKQIRYNKRNTRGVMIDGGNRIYILGLVTKNRVDLDSSMANRFFSSFRVLKPFKK